MPCTLPKVNAVRYLPRSPTPRACTVARASSTVEYISSVLSGAMQSSSPPPTPPPPAAPQSPHGGRHIIDGRVHSVGVVGGDAVFPAPDNTHLNFKNCAGTAAQFQQFLGDTEVLGEGNGGAIPHV